MSNSLAVVKVKNRGYTGSKVKAEALIETIQDREKKRSSHLTNSQRWRLRYLQKHTVKN